MTRGHWSAVVAAIGLAASLWAGLQIPPTWVVEKTSLQAERAADATWSFAFKGGRQIFQPATPETSVLLSRLGNPSNAPSPTTEEFVVDGDSVFKLTAARHWGMWSLLPAALSVFLCFLVREPVVALFAGVVSGALLLGRYDIPAEVLLPGVGSTTGATILVLYLWFLGGLMGIWSKTGAALAFAEWVTARFVRGPRSAKLAAWVLGVAIFQGGTLSTVLVGTAVRPVAEKQRVSREELSYIVDSTASPIAVLLPFNAWPVYVQSFIFVAGVPFLASESQRIAFFFSCIPLYIYPMLAVFLTLLTALGFFPPFARGLRAASERAAATGALDAPNAEPMLSPELSQSEPAEGYPRHVSEFLIPLAIIIGVSVGTFFVMGAPQVLWAFGIALLVAAASCSLRGMPLLQLMDGVQSGLKGVVYGSLILLLAVVVGGLSRDCGGGLFLLEMLGGRIWHPVLPVALAMMAMVIAFSTGTSWGTFAVALPLAMPLAWGIAQSSDLTNPGLYLAVCFAAVINGSIFGDQCSPISDTTVLSSLSTGCDLMDHVRTQAPPCLFAATVATISLALVAFVLG